MDKYDDGDIVRYYKNVLLKETRTRKRAYIDPRDYLIAILHYKFGYTEEILALTFGPIHRTTMNHAKKNPYFSLLYKDVTFLENTKTERLKFPYVFPNPTKSSTPPGRKYRVIIGLTRIEHEKLKKVSLAKGTRMDVTARRLLSKYLTQILNE
jgi:hypothetical protein